MQFWIAQGWTVSHLIANFFHGMDERIMIDVRFETQRLSVGVAIIIALARIAGDCGVGQTCVVVTTSPK